MSLESAGYNSIAVWLTLDINSSLDARFRALAKHTSGGAEEYDLPIKTVSASDVKIQSEYIEWNVDADQLTVYSVQCDNVIPYVQFQIQAGTVGATHP